MDFLFLNKGGQEVSSWFMIDITSPPPAINNEWSLILKVLSNKTDSNLLPYPLNNYCVHAKCNVYHNLVS